MAGYRPPYTLSEEVKILRYIIDNEAYLQLRGIKIWRKMAQSGELERTYESLKQHFRMKMLDKLHKSHFPNIPERQLRKIKLGYESTATGNADGLKTRKRQQVLNKNEKKKREVDLSVTPPSSPGSTTPDDFESATEDQD